MPSMMLKKSREKSVLRRHPWIFSGAVKRMDGDASPGETIDVLSNEGAWLAAAAYSPRSQIVGRVWTIDRDEPVTPAFLERRIEDALRPRRDLFAGRNIDALRLIHAESDGLPGLVVDRYGEFLVCQFLTVGVEFWKKEIVEILAGKTGCTGIYERSDVDSRTKEGLEKTTGVLFGRPPPGELEIREDEARFIVEITRGHKTGFYLDQRDNRILLGRHCAGKTVLNCFAYSGGFGVWALKGGAKSLVNIDTSAHALELADRNIRLNGGDAARVENLEEDVFHTLRRFRAQGNRFDVIVLDPPKFADSRANLNRAARGYKDINRLAFELLNDDGLLFTFSCSGILEPNLFQKIVADAALDAGCDGRILAQLGQPSDHPMSLHFPEGLYLKGLMIRKK